MGLVYWIYCNQTYKSYIGSTIQKIDERIKRHHRQIDCSSKQILDGGNYDIIILEDNINQDILKIREQFYMDCERKFKSSKDRQLDHDHQTGYIRDIVCNSCNQKRRFTDLLR